jgi:hypothetical protein
MMSVSSRSVFRCIKELHKMTGFKQGNVFKLTALAIAAAAVVTPVAWSSSNEIVIDKSTTFTVVSTTEPEMYDRFILTRRDSNSQTAAARGANTLSIASNKLGMTLQSVRTLSTGAEHQRSAARSGREQSHDGRDHRQ